MSPWPNKFKLAFCERFRCSERDYARRAMRWCLYRRALLVWPILRIIRPRFFQVDLDTIERVGDAQDWATFKAELAAFAAENRVRTGLWRNRFKFRLSGSRLTQLAEELFGPVPQSGPAADPILAKNRRPAAS